MARTGTGTRRPRAKTTGSGAKATTSQTPAEDAATGDVAGTSATASPKNEIPDSPETLTSQDTLAGGSNEDAPATEGATPSAGEAPEAAMSGEQPDAPALPAEPGDSSEASIAGSETTAEPTPEPPVASLTEPAVLPRTDKPEPSSPPPPPPPVRRGGLVPMVLGGVVAAAIGAGAVLALFPQGWQPADTTALQARLTAIETQLETQASPDAALAPLEERIAALENAAPDLQPLEERLSALEADETTDGLAQRIEQLEGDLSARIDAQIEARVDEGIERAMAGAQDRQAEQAQAIETAEQDLATARSELEARTALAELAAAAETGAPAPAALPALAAVTDLPPALDAFADGLPQVRALQTSFTAAARDALAAAPLDEGSTTGDRVMNFLRTQTGARSLAPREGGDTDAILSRAEAHVRAADLPAALSELDALPDGPAAAMADWRAQAESRVNALAALAEVHARLNNQ